MKNKNLRAALYSRISTVDKGQEINMQADELRAYAAARNWEVIEYSDKGISGAKDNRPGLNQLMRDAKARRFDVVLCWRLDRFGRSLKHLLTALDEFNSMGISFVSLRDSIDFSTAAGKLMFSIVGAFAEFERGILRERVKAGMLHARNVKKIHIGRKPTAPVYLARIIDLFEKEKGSVRQIAHKVNIPRATVQRTLKQYREGLINREGVTIK